MKKLHSVTLLAVALVLSFYSCEKTEDTVSQTRTIEKGGCISITGNAFPSICFDSLITDSRCPADAVCVWAGFAAVRLSIKNDAGIIQQFTLATQGFSNLPIPANDTTINGYHIKVVDVTPYPILSAPSQEPKKVKLEITY